jgi:hypothetical protein
MATEQRAKPFAIVGQGSIFDGIAYWATLAGVYIMVGGLMFYSGKGKLFDDDGNAPPAIKTQFKNTFIDTFPGTDAAWVILGILEFGVFALLLASLLWLEFLPHREKRLLQWDSRLRCWCSRCWRSDRQPPRNSRASRRCTRISARPSSSSSSSASCRRTAPTVGWAESARGNSQGTPRSGPW